MSKENFTIIESEKLKIELELKYQYYGQFISNVLREDQQEAWASLIAEKKDLNGDIHCMLSC